MNISEQAGIFTYLKTKGFILQESTPTRLRFEKQADGAEIIIVNNPGSLPVQINANGKTVDYTATDFQDLMNYLETTIK